MLCIMMIQIKLYFLIAHALICDCITDLNKVCMHARTYMHVCLLHACMYIYAYMLIIYKILLPI